MTARDSEDLVVSTIELISRKWHPIIVRRLLDAGPLGFNEIQEHAAGISAKVLTDSLADLVENELLERTVVSERPLRVEYDLTDRGRDLQSVIAALEAWGERHLQGVPDPLVLVVDDDPRLVSMYEGWLADRFRVLCAYSGEEAIRNATDDVDVVVLDRHMPGLSGDEVLARVRELGVDVGVVMLTAVGFDVDDGEAPFDAYVEKPSERAALVSVVEAVLRSSGDDRSARGVQSSPAAEALLRDAKTSGELAEGEAGAGPRTGIERMDRGVADAREPGHRTAEGTLSDGH